MANGCASIGNGPKIERLGPYGDSQIRAWPAKVRNATGCFSERFPRGATQICTKRELDAPCFWFLRFGAGMLSRPWTRSQPGQRDLSLEQIRLRQLGGWGLATPVITFPASRPLLSRQVHALKLRPHSTYFLTLKQRYLTGALPICERPLSVRPGVFDPDGRSVRPSIYQHRRLLRRSALTTQVIALTA